MTEINDALFNKQLCVKKKLDEMPEERKTLSDKQYDKRMKFSENLSEQIRFAYKNCGKHPFSLVKDLFRLHRGNGKLTKQEYFLYQLYNDEKYSEDDKAKFISDNIHWPITHKCCDMSWSALTEDKWLSYQFLEKCDIRVPKTIAVIDKTFRSFGSTPKISNPMQLKDFLNKKSVYPIFAKPNEGIGSFGAFIVTGSDDTHLFLGQSETVTFEKIFEEIIGEKTYLIQKFIHNHQILSCFSPYLATIRTINLVYSDSVATPFAVIKIPSQTSIADNYWREGNIIADIDPHKGVIRRAIRGKDIGLEEFDIHPENREKLVGLKLPCWDDLKRVNHECAKLFAPVRYQSLDIALTQDGPVVIEINTGGSFILPQIASGTGFLTDEIRNFFEDCGWIFRR